MDTQQMLELLLKKMDAYLVKMEARPEEELTLVDMIPGAAQEEDVPVEDAIVIPAGETEEEMTTITRKETLACQEMETRQEEEKPTSLDRKPEAAEEGQIPEENAEVIPVGEPRKKRRRDRNQRKINERNVSDECDTT
jgi:hypothetical protein